MRSGQEYLDSLVDGRRVIVDGEVVADVTRHPGFAGIAQSVARMYDYAADPVNDMTYTAPETGREALKPFMIPRSREDLASWRESIVKWHRLSHGFVGRSPDHVAAFMAAFAAHADVFDRGERRFADNVRAWYRKLLDESPFVSYVIIPPQVSRATTAHGWEGELVQLGVLEEREDGIVLRGAQMLGTGAAVSDYVLVSCIKPITAEDVDHAVTAMVPISAKGVKIYCRRPYAMEKPSTSDYPMSTRFDETDGLVVFDDVFVPWSDVFLCRDVEGLFAQWFHTGAHVLGNTQAQIRLSVKLRFLAGVARKMCEINGIDKIPTVREKLGDLAAIASTVEGMVLAGEAASYLDGAGLQHPEPRFLYSPLASQAETYAKVIAIIRELAGAGVLQVPSSFRELCDDEFRADIDRYIQSPGYPAEERIKFFKLVWDVIGSEFAGRHSQYEMFYAGAPFITKGYSFRNYCFADAVAEVEAFVGSYDAVPAEVSGPAGVGAAS